MEIFVVIGAIVVGLMFWVIRSAQTLGDNARGDYQAGIAERKLAEERLEKTKQEGELIKQKIARDRALVLQEARSEAENKIKLANQHSLALLHEKATERGEMEVQFGDGFETNGVPTIDWKWSPFSNAVLKIYRQSGGIMEAIDQVIAHGGLIHVERKRAEGSYADREAEIGKTYNYYAFVEARRTAYRPKAVQRDLPPEMATGPVIDQQGKEISHFSTFEPEEYEDIVYFDFDYQRLTVTQPLSDLDKKRASLDERKSSIDLRKYEADLDALEEDLLLETGDLDTESLERIVANARKQTAYQKRANEVLDEIENDSSLSVEEKEIIRERIISKLAH